jgi:NADH-quinone oxidoreductase subunit J
MTLAGFFFYLFAVVMIASAIMVISVRNPVHAVLFLILTFFNAAGLFVLLGAEFIAMILIIVYVGAVLVLFLFVVMMLDVDFAALRAGFAKYLPIGGLIGGVLLAQLLLVMSAWVIAPQGALRITDPIPAAVEVTNAEAIGRVLYTRYVYFFELAGMVLLVAMIGAIVLTLRHRAGVKRQSIAVQVARDPRTAIELRKVETGRGIETS